MRSQEEHVNQVGFLRWCELHEKHNPALARWFSVPNGGARNLIVAAKLKQEGVRRGVCDLFNLTRGRGGQSGLILEFKSDTGRLTPEQKDWCDYFRSQGFRVEVPRSWVEAALITIDYFELPKSLKKNLPLHRIKGAA